MKYLLIISIILLVSISSIATPKFHYLETVSLIKNRNDEDIFFNLEKRKAYITSFSKNEEWCIKSKVSYDVRFELTDQFMNRTICEEDLK